VEGQPVESAPDNDISEWLKSLDVEGQNPPGDAVSPIVEPPQFVPGASSVEVEPQQPSAAAEELPEWLGGMHTPAEQGQASQDDLPDWLKDQSADEQPPASVAAPAWVPAEETPSPSLGVMEPPAAEAPVNETATQPPAESASAVVSPTDISFDVPSLEPEPVPVVSTPPASVRPPVRETGLVGDKDGPALQKARDLMAHGGLDAAVSEYARLVKRGKLLEEIIYDLKEATYSHPVDVVIWQALGDAHMRANQLQEALDAYTKAEELLR